jgi:hypothetical protein
LTIKVVLKVQITGDVRLLRLKGCDRAGLGRHIIDRFQRDTVSAIPNSKSIRYILVFFKRREVY